MELVVGTIEAGVSRNNRLSQLYCILFIQATIFVSNSKFTLAEPGSIGEGNRRTYSIIL